MILVGVGTLWKNKSKSEFKFEKVHSTIVMNSFVSNYYCKFELVYSMQIKNQFIQSMAINSLKYFSWHKICERFFSFEKKCQPGVDSLNVSLLIITIKIYFPVHFEYTSVNLKIHESFDASKQKNGPAQAFIYTHNKAQYTHWNNFSQQWQQQQSTQT